MNKNNLLICMETYVDCLIIITNQHLLSLNDLVALLGHEQCFFDSLLV